MGTISICHAVDATTVPSGLLSRGHGRVCQEGLHNSHGHPTAFTVEDHTGLTTGGPQQPTPQRTLAAFSMRLSRAISTQLRRCCCTPPRKSCYRSGQRPGLPLHPKRCICPRPQSQSCSMGTQSPILCAAQSLRPWIHCCSASTCFPGLASMGAPRVPMPETAGKAYR